MKKVTIVGSGLVGSLWSVYLTKAGYEVSVYERRTDMRKTRIAAGKSINLATSYRGWKALDEVGLGDEIRKIAIPMYGRTLHSVNSGSSYQPYGINGQAIYSVSRGAINAKLMDFAEEKAKLFFNEECISADAENGVCYFKNTLSGKITEVKSDLVFATDGAFSSVRYNALQKSDRFSYSQNYIDDGYKEILLPANEDGTFKLAENTLHIWPRGRFMLIALPNFDGSFTCTLFMPFEGDKHCFSNLTSKEKITDFFKTIFPDFYTMVPDIADIWDNYPLSSLAIIRCFPWHKEKVMLMGDAAHATVPFFGQGMNAGFEDCTVMWELMKKHKENWEEIFSEFEKIRKPDGDAVQDLSLQNYMVMRDHVTDPAYQLQQKIERRISHLFPDKYFPLYSMVSFTDIQYHVALEKGNKQTELIAKLIESHHITNHTTTQEIDEIIFELMGIKELSVEPK